MENIKLRVRALAANMGVSVEALADLCGIERPHLKQVSAGNVVMTAYDLRKLSQVTGVPTENIYVKGVDD